MRALLVICGVVLLILIFWSVFSPETVSAVGIAVQAVATLALVICTYLYLREAARQARTSEAALQEARRSRELAMLPIVGISTTTSQIEDRHRVILVNVGNGPAFSVEAYISVVVPHENYLEFDDVRKHPQMTKSIQPHPRVMGAVLASSDGSNESGIEILVQVVSMGSLFRKGRYGNALIIYKDIMGNGYATVVRGSDHYFGKIFSLSEVDKKKQEIWRETRKAISGEKLDNLICILEKFDSL